MFEEIPSGLSPDQFIRMALAEDTGDGDHTSISTIDAEMIGIAKVKMKDNGIIAGLNQFPFLLHQG